MPSACGVHAIDVCASQFRESTPLPTRSSRFETSAQPATHKQPAPTDLFKRNNTTISEHWAHSSVRGSGPLDPLALPEKHSRKPRCGWRRGVSRCREHRQRSASPPHGGSGGGRQRVAVAVRGSQERQGNTNDQNHQPREPRQRGRRPQVFLALSKSNTKDILATEVRCAPASGGKRGPSGRRCGGAPSPTQKREPLCSTSGATAPSRTPRSKEWIFITLGICHVPGCLAG